ncbi:acyl-CoA thioesterase [bacterium]|nr:acyl-CoA thioesterase [bacterium]
MLQTRIKVRGYHLDIYGHVNNARYLEFLEEGRWALLDQHKAVEEVHQQGLNFTIVNLNINYRYAATAGDEIIVETSSFSFGNKSAVVDQKIVLARDPSVVVVDAKITFVLMDSKTGKAVVLTDELKNKLS